MSRDSGHSLLRMAASGDLDGMIKATLTHHQSIKSGKLLAFEARKTELPSDEFDVDASDSDGGDPPSAVAAGGSVPGIDVTDADGLSPLMVSASKGHADIVRWLLVNGADPSLQTHECGSIALHFAAKSGQVDVCRLLCDLVPDIPDDVCVNFSKYVAPLVSRLWWCLWWCRCGCGGDFCGVQPRSRASPAGKAPLSNSLRSSPLSPLQRRR